MLPLLCKCALHLCVESLHRFHIILPLLFHIWTIKHLSVSRICFPHWMSGFFWVHFSKVLSLRVVWGRKEWSTLWSRKVTQLMSSIFSIGKPWTGHLSSLSNVPVLTHHHIWMNHTVLWDSGRGWCDPSSVLLLLEHLAQWPSHYRHFWILPDRAISPIVPYVNTYLFQHLVSFNCSFCLPI
jgi:hypothetical protein